MYALLDKVENLIKQSELYDANLTFKVFLRNDPSNYTFLPFQFPNDCSGWAIPGIKNIYLYQSDCATNSTYNPRGDVRSITSVLAHEMVHVMVENRFFFIKAKKLGLIK